MQGVLGLPKSDADWVPHAAAVLKKASAASKQPDNPFQRAFDSAREEEGALVQLINKGVAADAFNDLILARVHIETNYRLVNVGGVSSDDLAILGAHVLRQAQALIRARDEQSAAYAKAAMFLSMADDNYPATSTVRRILQVLDASGMTFFSREVRDGLNDFCTQLQAERQRLQEPQEDAYWAVEHVLRSEDKVLPPKLLEPACARLDAYWRGCISNTDRFRCARAAWWLLNLARKRQDQTALRRIESLLKAWRQEAQGAIPKRWLTEALERVGEANAGLIACMVQTKAGKVIALDHSATAAEAKAIMALDHDPTVEELHEIRRQHGKK
jgi:hypothetical protein